MHLQTAVAAGSMEHNKIRSREMMSQLCQAVLQYLPSPGAGVIHSTASMMLTLLAGIRYGTTTAM